MRKRPNQIGTAYAIKEKATGYYFCNNFDNRRRRNTTAASPDKAHYSTGNVRLFSKLRIAKTALTRYCDGVYSGGYADKPEVIPGTERNREDYKIVRVLLVAHPL